MSTNAVKYLKSNSQSFKTNIFQFIIPVADKDWKQGQLQKKIINFYYL